MTVTTPDSAIASPAGDVDPTGRSTKRRIPRVPTVVVVVVGLCALLAPVLSSYAQNGGSLLATFIEPFGRDGAGALHVFGTDQNGRDIATRLLYGARSSLTVGLVGVLIAAAFGSAVGLVSGLVGRWVDAVLMRIVDIVLSVPPILIAILLAGTSRPSLASVFFVIGVLLWPGYARLVRGEVLGIRTMDYVELAKVAGCSRLTIARRHLLPNVLPSILVLATVHVGTAIVLESSLSFLGVGLPPDIASWGGMVNDGRGLLPIAWWPSVLPGLCIFVTVFAFNKLGDWARIRFDPRMDVA
ncbi:ABC transporter permease [Amycolatopsis sp. NPDC051372]|uniref:ABC transporter permease n=1 Tax=Amycolatopsis sp. NPDC051372 TaxID=3155669 RepID=UPI00344A3B50